MRLAENIYRFRTRQNMSQLDLADALEVSRQSVSKWETGTAVPELDKLVKMCDLFDISLDDLVGRKQEAHPAMPDRDPNGSAKCTAVQGVDTADLASFLLLLFAILIPVIVLTTSKSHNSTFLMVFGLLITPPLATLIAASLSPKNNLLFWIYAVYDVTFGILAAVAANVLAPFVVILYVFVIGFWNDARNKEAAA